MSSSWSAKCRYQAITTSGYERLLELLTGILCKKAQYHESDTPALSLLLMTIAHPTEFSILKNNRERHFVFSPTPRR